MELIITLDEKGTIGLRIPKGLSPLETVGILEVAKSIVLNDDRIKDIEKEV